jgi:hypothetical protein
MKCIEIRVGYPSRVLNPNATPNKHVKNRSKAAARSEGYYAALAAGAKRLKLPPEGKIPLRLAFHPPDLRKRDDDNAVASFKHHRDGIADALGIDDNRFITDPRYLAPVRPHGCVVVTIGESS